MRRPERELIEAALALDALWDGLGSCETAGDAWPATKRFIDACEAMRKAAAITQSSRHARTRLVLPKATTDECSGSYEEYIASLEPCPECGRVDEMDNIEGRLLCAACSLDEMDADEWDEDNL